MTNMQLKTKKKILIAIISLFVLSMLATVPLALATGTPVDLTLDYAKAGDTINMLSFNIVGPAGGTTLTSVSIAYTGTNLTDLSWARVWTSAANATAGTSLSVNTAGITDANGRAIRIVTTATASRTFDYVFAYQID